MRLALSDVAMALRDLREVFSPPKGVPPERMAERYLNALSGLGPDELRHAVQEAIRTESHFWPKPAKLWQLGMEYRKAHPTTYNGPRSLGQQFSEWERDGMNGPCPVCGSVMEWPDGQRGGVRHEGQRHKEVGIEYTIPAWAA